MSAASAVLTGALLCYLLGAVCHAAYLSTRRDRFLFIGQFGGIGGVLLHTVAIGLRCAALKQAPFVTPGESLSLLAFLVAILYLIVSASARHLSAIGGFALGLSFLLLFVGEGVQRPLNAPPLLSENGVSVHIFATLAAFAAFALAFCCAALYLVEHRLLKSRNGLTWLKRLPPLVAVENTAFLLVAVGFPLLTLGILSGLARAITGGMAHGWQIDPKSLLAFAVWGVYGVYLTVRLRAEWTPLRTSYVLLVGLALCALLFVVPTAAHRFP